MRQTQNDITGGSATSQPLIYKDPYDKRINNREKVQGHTALSITMGMMLNGLEKASFPKKYM